MKEEKDEKPVAVPMRECSGCHRQVIATAGFNVSGRWLCFGCAAAWFSEDEEGDE